MGGVQHLTGECFKFATGIQMEHVSFEQAAPAHADLTAGRVQLMFQNVPSVAPHVRAGSDNDTRLAMTR